MGKNEIEKYITKIGIHPEAFPKSVWNLSGKNGNFRNNLQMAGYSISSDI